MAASTKDLLPDVVTLVIGRTDRKAITVGPVKIGGVVIDRTDKRLRFLVKKTKETDDTEAVIDLNSHDDTARVFGASIAPAAGDWVIDIAGILPAVGAWWARIVLYDDTTVDKTGDTVGRINLIVQDQ